MSARLYTCPECGRRGVTEKKGRREGRFRCRYCGHYPFWLQPPVEKGRRQLIG